MSLYVVCDNGSSFVGRKFTSTFFLDIRKIDNCVIAARDKYMLEELKRREDFVVQIESGLLTRFCRDTRSRIVVMDRCYCDINTKKAVCEMSYL